MLAPFGAVRYVHGGQYLSGDLALELERVRQSGKSNVGLYRHGRRTVRWTSRLSVFLFFVVGKIKNTERRCMWTTVIRTSSLVDAEKSSLFSSLFALCWKPIALK